MQFNESPRAGREIADDQQRPFIADQVERPGVGRPLIVWVAFGRGYVRNDCLPMDGILPTKFESNGGYTRQNRNFGQIDESFRQFSSRAPLWGEMGELIVLAERRVDRPRPTNGTRPAFYFDLACPFSYLAAERVERVLGDVDWIPTATSLLRPPVGRGESTAVRAHAETCAVALRLPLVWPDRFPADAPGALRAAAHAVEIGAGARFALAASRLAFCGGFDLEDPEILAEAAAAAGIGLRECLTAAGDPTRDEPLLTTARGLITHGVGRIPAIRVGTRWFDGDGALASAAAFLRADAACDRPFAS